MDREYFGIDLHRRRSVIYRMNAAGEKLECVRIDNERLHYARAPGGLRGAPLRAHRFATVVILRLQASVVYRRHDERISGMAERKRRDARGGEMESGGP